MVYAVGGIQHCRRSDTAQAESAEDVSVAEGPRLQQSCKLERHRCKEL